MAEFTGYHGTELRNVQCILTTKQMRKSRGDHQWLGDGVYFFTDPVWAQWWCVEERNYRRWGIITCQIVVADEYLWDLTTTDGQELLELAYEVVQAMSARLNKPVQQQTPTDAEAINFGCLKFNKKVVLNEFTVRNNKYPRSRILRPKQIQLCVRDERCMGIPQQYVV